MEGFWTVQFAGVQGMGAGVIALVGGALFGGDSAFLYEGTYMQQANTLTAQVHVSRYAAGVGNVMGRDTFDLDLTGTIEGSAGKLSGTVPGTPMRFSASIAKRGDLPKV